MGVRTATLDDAPAIARVHVRTWQRAYAHILPAGYLDAIDVAGRTSMWQQVMGLPPTRGAVYVAERPGGDLAGFISVGTYRPDGGSPTEAQVGQVFALYVDPADWSTGVGRALMDAGVAHLTDAGYTEIRLWVFEDNPRARRFYEHAGFVEDGEMLTETTDPGGPYETESVEIRYTRRAM